MREAFSPAEMFISQVTVPDRNVLATEKKEDFE